MSSMSRRCIDRLRHKKPNISFSCLSKTPGNWNFIKIKSYLQLNSESNMSKRKTLPSNVNQDFCDFLMELADYERNVSRNTHKYNAYKNAASVLAQHETRIRSGSEARELKGIGLKISEKIDEFLKTGSVQKLSKIRSEESTASINELIRVSGIGPAKASQLVKEGITSIEQLKNADSSILTHHQKIGLTHFDDFEKRIPCDEVLLIEKELRKIIHGVDIKYEITICGSFRRGAENSGDVDALLTHPDYTTASSEKNQRLKSIVKALESQNLVTDTLSLGPTKFMGVCNISKKLPYRRLDIRLIPADQYHCGILYFTGSDVFNKSMRAHALEKGFTLNEYSLRPVGSTGVPGEPVPIESERDVFDYIEYKYVSPEGRNFALEAESDGASITLSETSQHKKIRH